MAEILRKNSTVVEGPFLLPEQSLTDLDRLLAEEWARLSDEKKREMDKEFRRAREEYRRSRLYELHDEAHRKEYEKEIRTRVEGSYRYTRDKREWKVELENLDAVVDGTYEALRLHAEVRGRIPKGLDIRMIVGEVDAHITWRHVVGDSLKITVDPANSPNAVAFFGKLDDWADRIRPYPLWRVFTLPWFFVIFIAIMLSNLGFGLANSTGPSPHQQLTNEARELLDQGVTKENANRAVELVLGLQVGYAKDGVRRGMANWFWTYLIVLIGLTIALCLPIRAVIAIGSGIALVRNQQRWRYSLAVIVPTFIVMGVLASTLGSAIWDGLKGR